MSIFTSLSITIIYLLLASSGIAERTSSLNKSIKEGATQLSKNNPGTETNNGATKKICSFHHPNKCSLNFKQTTIGSAKITKYLFTFISPLSLGTHSGLSPPKII